MEQLRWWTICLALGSVSFGSPNLASADMSIAPSVASLFVGQEKIVEGTVTAAEREGNTVRLRLGTPPHELMVSLIIGMLSTFPPEPERYYTGKAVRVAGLIRSFRGTVEIAVHDATEIEVVGAPRAPGLAAPAGDPVKAVPEPPAQPPLDALSERLRALEERVQRLEGAPPR